jgi:hypothetical protein
MNVIKRIKDLIIKNSPKNPFVKTSQGHIIDPEKNKKLLNLKTEIKGFLNPFIDVEVIYKGESLLHESLSMLVNTRMKDYGLFENYPEEALYQSEIILRLPTGSQMNFPLVLKSLDQKQFRQRGDNAPKA